MSKKYIFPLNYNRKEKLLGIIDYKTGVILLIISLILLYILKNIQITVKIKVVIFVVCFGMPAIFLIIGVNGESTIDVIMSAIKYLLKPKRFVYRKEVHNEINKINKTYNPYKLYKSRFNKG